MTPDEKCLAAHMLAEFESPRRPLSAKQEGLVASFSDQLDSRGFLSGRQLEVLTEIYRDHTA